MTTAHINVVAVKRGANADSPWAQDVVAACKSLGFKTAILSDSDPLRKRGSPQ